MRNSQPISTVDSGYEGTTANYCIYLLGILHIFRPQNYRFLQQLRIYQPTKNLAIFLSYL